MVSNPAVRGASVSFELNSHARKPGAKAGGVCPLIWSVARHTSRAPAGIPLESE